MDSFTISRTTGRAVRFKGTLIASQFSNRGETTGSIYKLYRTSGDNFVCHLETWTKWQGQTGEDTVELARTEDEVFEFFGGSAMAQALYREAGLDFFEEVE